MINIGFDAKRIFQNSTGLGNYSRDLVRNLKIEHPEVNCFLVGKTKERHPKYSAEFAESFNYKIISPKPFQPYVWWRRFGLSYALKKLDIFHGLSNEMPTINRALKIKKVISIHDVIHKIYPKHYSFIDRQFYHQKILHGTKMADKIIAISENTKQDLILHYRLDENKIEVLPPNIHPVFFEKSSSQIENFPALPKKYFVVIGSITPRKNLLGIIEAYRLIHQKLATKVVVIGHGKDYLRKCKEKIAAYHLKDKFHFLSNVKSMEMLRHILSESEGLLYPSLYEGFGIPPIEAMLCRIPVLCSNVSSMPDATNHLASYCDPKDVEDIGKKILDLQAVSLQKLVKAEQFAINTYNRKNLSKKLMDIYQSLF